MNKTKHIRFELKKHREFNSHNKAEKKEIQVHFNTNNNKE
jgi:hypothetical protein